MFICALCVSTFNFDKNPFNGINRSRKLTFANASRLFLAIVWKAVKGVILFILNSILILATFLPPISQKGSSSWQTKDAPQFVNKIFYPPA